jgi:hypothetical protein
VLAVQPGVQFFLGLRPGHAASFLQLAEELVFFTGDRLNVIVGQLCQTSREPILLIDSICLRLRSNS